MTSSPARLFRNVWRSAKHKLVRRLATLLPQARSTESGSQRIAWPAFARFRDALATVLQTCELRVGRYYHKWSAAAPQQPSRRRRDLLPLPKLVDWPAQVDTQQLSEAI